MKKNKKRNKKKLRHQLIQFIEYNIAGIAFFWSGYAVLLGMDYYGAPLWLSSTTSYLVGLTINFLLERYWVFRDNKDASAIKLAGERYLAISGINLILNYVILKSLEVAGVPIAFAPFISSAMFTPWNWLWYKFWVFKGKEMPKHIRKKHVKARVKRKK